jgi:hypothetical protein
MARRSALALVAVAAIATGCGAAAKDHAGATTAGTQRVSSTPAGARAITVVGRQRLGARLEDWTLRTQALSDPTGVRVLLPAGYASDSRRRYPVLYLLYRIQDKTVAEHWACRHDISGFRQLGLQPAAR